MKTEDLLKIIKETTTEMLTIVRLHVQLKGQQSSARLIDSANQLVTDENEEVSMQNAPRVFTSQEELCYQTIMTNIIRLLFINQSNVNGYCTQCLSTLLNILSQESNLVKCECPSNLMDLYKDIKNNEEFKHESRIDLLSRVMFFIYRNIC